MPGIIQIAGWTGSPIGGDGEGDSYTQHTGHGCGILLPFGRGEGDYRSHYRGIGCAVAPPLYGALAEGMMIPQYKGGAIGAALFIFIGRGEGELMPVDVRGGGCGVFLDTPYGKADGLTYNPRLGTYDLQPILMYLQNFLPELDGPLPSPLPPQEKVSLHVLHSREWSFEEHGDRDNWFLMGMSYEGKPVAIFRRAPASQFPMRHILDREGYMRAITYLGRLWEVERVSIKLPQERLTQEELREVTTHLRYPS